MPKVPPPQVGFNNNVKHRGRVFHIQTEDSGVNHPHITTHLFVDGGRIVKSQRTDYSENLSKPNLGALLRRQMKEQHKAMFMSLRQGKLDHLIDELFKAAPPSKRANGHSVPPLPASKLKSAPAAARPATIPPSFARPQAPSSLLGHGVEAKDPGTRVSNSQRASGEKVRSDTPPSSKSRGSNRSPSHLEHAESATSTRPAVQESPDSSSLFGDVKISEQSLDDVILSYISDDLRPPEDG